MAETATLICPKCGGEMRSYERSGIVVDQCGECRGIYLDRGELERLLDAESIVAHNDDQRSDHEQGGLRDERHGKRRASSLFEQLLGGD